MDLFFFCQTLQSAFSIKVKSLLQQPNNKWQADIYEQVANSCVDKALKGFSFSYIIVTI
jgi:hypothetical protein